MIEIIFREVLAAAISQNTFCTTRELRLVFLTLFSVTVWISDRTLFLVFDTLYPYNLLGTGHEIEMTCPMQLGLFPDPAGVIQYVTTGS